MGYIFATKARIDNRKKLVKQQYVPTIGPLAAEIGLPVWGTPCKFQRLSRLGSVTARQSTSERQPNFVALNRGRPSRWASAHVPVMAALRSRCGHYILSCFLWSPYGIGQAIIFLPCSFCLSSIFFLFFPRLISAVADWMSAILAYMVWPWCVFKIQAETCCTWLAENTGRKNSPKSRHLGTIA